MTAPAGTAPAPARRASGARSGGDPAPGGRVLRVRWLGRVAYRDAHALQHALHARSADDHLLLLEHPDVYTLGVRAWRDPRHLLVPPEELGADVVRADRGGDVTWHGPGQLVGYPVLSVPAGPGATPRYVRDVEQLVIDVLADLGLADAGRREGHPGVWVGGAKVCAVGVRLTRGRSMHGFALNVDPDLSRFSAIVPCGIADASVTSLAAEGVAVPMRDVVDAVVRRAGERWGPGGVERQDVAWRRAPTALAGTGAEPAPGEGAGPASTAAPGTGAEPAPGEGAGPASTAPPGGGAAPAPGEGAGPAPAPVRLLGRLAQAGVPGTGLPVGERKPPWLRAQARMGEEFRSLRRTMRSLELVTVCEEAGCPNIFECWGEGTATFMINGDRCTRACGFCLVDTRRPLVVDPGEPARVAEAVARMGLRHAVVTAVARDDLDDGGASAFARTVDAIRARCPGIAVELLVPDCKGDPAALATVFAARPDVLNHNLETVVRLQRAVRPSASYARSLAVLARAKEAGLVTKSGLMLGLGEGEAEVAGALADLRAVGVEIVTLGQYLRPSVAHLPVARWWHPDEFARLRREASALGFAHVEASPLTRSSYHAGGAARHAAAARP